MDAASKALWRFDEAAAVDDAADLRASYTLAQFGTPTVVVGKIANARRLNGSSMFFQKQGDAPLGTVFNGDWTIETWINVDPSTSNGEIFFYGGLNFTTVNLDTPLVDLFALSTGQVGFRHWHNTASFSTGLASTSPAFDTWNHFAVTRALVSGNSVFNVYLNGVLSSNFFMGPLDFSVPGNTHYIGVGNYTTPAGLGHGAGFMTGQIDDTRVSNFARAAVEIRMSYDRGIGG